MLDALRKGAGGWFSQLLIAILVVGFAVWGVAARGIFTGFHADRVAIVGGTPITIPQFQRQYDLAQRQLSQRFGQQISPQQAQMLGLPAQVLGQLVAEATLDDAATNLGIGVSNAALVSEIAKDPSFKDSSGKFNRGLLLQILRSNNLSEDQFVNDQRQVYKRQQLAQALIGGVTVPDIYMQAIHEYRTDERTLSYIVLGKAQIGDIPEPSSTELQGYFDAHKDTWKAPELRALNYFILSPDTLAHPDQVTDDAAKKVYDSQIARYTTPERREVSQIVFKTDEAAAAASAAISSGKSFDDIVKERNLKPSDVNLGTVTKSQMVDPAIADAAFSLAENTTSGVVKGRFGPTIIHVGKVDPKVVKPFDDVKADIKKQIATAQAANEVTDQKNAIEDAIAGGKTLAEVAKSYDLKLVTVPAVDKSGDGPDGKPVSGLPTDSNFLSQIFQTDVGLQNAAVSLGGDSYVWFDVTSVTPAHDRQLSDVSDKVTAAWKKGQLAEKLDNKANEIRDRLAKGEDINTIAKDLGLEVKTVDKITRASKPTGDLSTAAIHAAFNGPKGSAAVAPGIGEDTRDIMVVTDVNRPAYFAGTPDQKQTEQQLSQQLSNDLLQQFIAQEQDRLGVSINQQNVQQIIGGTGS